MRQLTIYDFIPLPQKRTLCDFFDACIKNEEFQFTQDELMEEQRKLGDDCEWYFYMTENKCCGCYPFLRETKSLHKPLSYCECLICHRKTKPIDDYSWINTQKQWDSMMLNI